MRRRWRRRGKPGILCKKIHNDHVHEYDVDDDGNLGTLADGAVTPIDPTSLLTQEPTDGCPPGPPRPPGPPGTPLRPDNRQDDGHNIVGA